jgi:hypothetical protein
VAPIVLEALVDILKQHAGLCKLQDDVEVVVGHKDVLELDHVWVVEHIVVLEPEGR